MAEGFAKYLKNSLTDLHQTFRLLKQLCKSSFEIKSLGIGHLLLPWQPVSGGSAWLKHDQRGKFSNKIFLI